MRLSFFRIATTFVAAASIMGCAVPNNRTLASIDVLPASGSATQAGTVQFKAIGVLAQAPNVISPLTVNWSFTGFTTIPIDSRVTIDANGLATCGTFKGTVRVYAIHPVDADTPPPSQIGPGLGMGFVGGTGLLTCN